jgi:hypothetical protein
MRQKVLGLTRHLGLRLGPVSSKVLSNGPAYSALPNAWLANTDNSGFATGKEDTKWRHQEPVTQYNRLGIPAKRLHNWIE